MHVRALKVFCDVVGRRSFSRAADENDISQSGVSQIVQQLEDHLGVKLIDRSRRPFVLTSAGQVYYDGCRRLVQSLYALEEKVRTLHQEVDGRVNVAAIYSVGLSYGKHWLAEFNGRYPKATINLDYHHPNRVYELVAGNQADLGLVSCAHQTREVKAEPWREEPMILVCSPAHALARRASLRLQDLNGLEIVGFDPDLAIRRLIDRDLSDRQVQLQVTMAFDNIDTIKRAIAVNAGVSLLPEPTVRSELQAGSLLAVPVEGLDLVRPLGIIYRRGTELGTTARRFLELLQEEASAPHQAGARCSSNVFPNGHVDGKRGRSSPPKKARAGSRGAGQ